MTMVPAEFVQGDALPSFSSCIVNSVLFIFLCFLFVILLFDPKVWCWICVYRTSVLKHMNTVMSVREKISVLDKLHLGMSYTQIPVVVCSMFMTQQHILNKVSLNKNTLNKFCVDQLMILLSEACRNPTLCLP